MSIESSPALRGDLSGCAACRLCFTSTSAFDRHRYGPYSSRRCLTEADLSAAGWKPNARGFWRKPMTTAHFTFNQENASA